MSRPAGLGKRDFSNNSTDDIVGPSTVIELLAAGNSADFSNTRTNPPPRFITCESAGTITVTDWEDNVLVLQLLQGQVRAFRPKTISAATTADIALEW